MGGVRYNSLLSLAKQRDYLTGNEKTAPELPDLTQESEADHWIRTSPEAFCNTTDKKILSQVLNNYDQETTDFYRWKVEYTQDELSVLILKRSGIDYGQIIDLVPVARGTSEFNPDTMRFEMTSFLDVALSPFAINKFTHTVTSS